MGRRALENPTHTFREDTHMSHTRTLTIRARAGVAALTLVLGASLAACGEEEATPAATDAADSLVVEDPWVRSTDGAKDASMTGAFMVLDNEGDEAVTLVGASTDLATKVELHEMAMADGKAVMQEVEDGIVLEAGKGQLLQPGGMHVMLMGLTEPLEAGEEVELTLELSDGSTTTVTAPVKAFTEEEGHYHAPGTPKHDH